MPHDRVQRALDGELPLDQLDAAETELYHKYRQAFAAALQPVRELPDVDVAPAVLRMIAEAQDLVSPQRHDRRPPRRRGAAVLGWLWAPWTITLRPAFGIAAAALAAVLWVTQIATPAAPLADPPVAAAATAPMRMVVEFRLAAPDARAVALVGDFNSWRPEHQLRQTAPGVWTVSVALEPGVYDYGFVVDGSTVRLDPLAPRVADGFGGESSRVAVLAPEVRS